MLLSMANRPIDSNTTFSTGGDVSRFQRRTVPGKPNFGGVGGMAGYGGRPSPSLPGAAAPAAPVGPVVRIARGNNVTTVPVGGR